MRKGTLFAVLFSVPLALAAQYPGKGPGQADTLPEHYRKKIQRYLDKDQSLDRYYSFDKKGIKIFASPGMKEKDSAEFFLSWQDIPGFMDLDVTNMVKTYNAGGDKSYVITGGLPVIFSDVPQDKPLTGRKIAIDPGHVGGTEEDAKRERKIVHNDEDTTGVPLIEGNLTMQTALLLKKSLEARGAQVMLTRSKEGENAFGMSYEEWLKKSFKKAVSEALRKGEINASDKKKLLDPKTTKEYIYRNFFIQEELKMRARKINIFRPDLTIVIHYNADETNKRWLKASARNFNMVFVAGSFRENELETKRDRLEFLRLMLSDDIDHSVSAAASLINAFVRVLKVPAAGENDASYLSANCLATPVKGVFCRNLELTRYVHGTLIYGESLYQDNEKEFKLLGNQDMTLDGIKTSIRVKQVADAYTEAVLNYFRSIRY
jgi:N-acetylmuramoyl-L-alanine amidase